MREVTQTTVVRLANCSVVSKAPKLEKCCGVFLTKCWNTTPIDDIEILNQTFQHKIVTSAFSNCSDQNPSDEVEIKWEGGHLGHMLWKGDVSDFTINVGLRSIKVSAYFLSRLPGMANPGRISRVEKIRDGIRGPKNPGRDRNPGIRITNKS